MSFMQRSGLISTAESMRTTARNMRIFADLVRYFKPENAAEMLRQAEGLEQQAGTMESAALAR